MHPLKSLKPLTEVQFLPFSSPYQSCGYPISNQRGTRIAWSHTASGGSTIPQCFYLLVCLFVFLFVFFPFVSYLAEAPAAAAVSLSVGGHKPPAISPVRECSVHI
uniref:Expressed sequence AI427809 n=1 Tax=Mus musculus TaxID=10090 RepID=Q3TAG4_MOUSE|nr:Expressed sequence AI427809 [Mus musculus]AAI47548.1 Expressed sequence AI427809 [Mus musculus]BAE25931.1 unnamed protein product [Mus musculus]BAE42704.1 unnamed protein product [Mus musculus]